MIMFYYDSFNIYSKIKILNIVFLSKIMKEIKVKRIINNVLNEGDYIELDPMNNL